METEVDGNEPVRLHHQDIQVTGDEQEESNEVARTKHKGPARCNVETNVENVKSKLKNKRDCQAGYENMAWFYLVFESDEHP